jgi:hypothetical protein
LNDIVEREAPTENWSSGSPSENNDCDGGDNNEDSDNNRVSEFLSFHHNDYLCDEDECIDDDDDDKYDDGFTNHTSRPLFVESQDTGAGGGVSRVA